MNTKTAKILVSLLLVGFAWPLAGCDEDDFYVGGRGGWSVSDVLIDYWPGYDGYAYDEVEYYEETSYVTTDTYVYDVGYYDYGYTDYYGGYDQDWWKSKKSGKTK